MEDYHLSLCFINLKFPFSFHYHFLLVNFSAEIFRKAFWGKLSLGKRNNWVSDPCVYI